jgi:hypothetical protein
MTIITTKHNQQQHQQKKEQDNNNVVDNYYNNNNNRRTNKQTPRVCKLGCWMEDLRHTHPNLFIGQIDNAFLLFNIALYACNGKGRSGYDRLCI